MSQVGIYVPGENFTFVTGTFIVTRMGNYWGCIKNRASLFYGCLYRLIFIASRKWTVDIGSLGNMKEAPMNRGPFQV